MKRLPGLLRLRRYGRDSGGELPSGRELLSFFLPFAGTVKAEILLLAGASAGEVMLLWTIPALQARVVDALTLRDGVALRPVLIAAVAAALALPVLQRGGDLLRIRALLRLNVAIRKELHRKILSLPLDYFDAAHSGGSAPRIFAAAEALASFGFNGLFAGASALLRTIGGMVILGGFAWYLPLPLLFLLPLQWLLLRRLAARRRNLVCRSSREIAAGRNLSQETFANMPLIKSGTAEERIGSRLHYRFLRQKAVAVECLRSAFLASCLSRALPLLLRGGIGLVGIFQVLAGGWSPGTLWAVFRYITQVETPLRSLILWREQFETVRGEALPLTELFRHESEETGKKVPVFGRKLSGAVEFCDVSFGYRERPPVLRHLSLTVPAGSLSVLTGPSGGGKSTVAKLLPRFYEPASGEIRIGGVPLTTRSPEEIRRNIGYVHQKPLLFSGTLAANLRFSRPGATEEEMAEALTRAGLTGFQQALPDGWSQLLGERGSALSAGQQMRLAIARELLKNPALLILDEPTAALDGLSAAEISEFCRNRPIGQTILLITHDRELMNLADRIFLLDRGRIAASGTERELAAASELFRRLIHRKRRGDTDTERGGSGRGDKIRRRIHTGRRGARAGGVSRRASRTSGA